VDTYVRSLPYFRRGTTGGNTSCVEIRGQGTEIILDAGSGIRQLGLDLMQGPFGQGKGTIHLLISHTHWDHIMGFPFFGPAMLPKSNHDLRPAPAHQAAVRGPAASRHFPVTLDTMLADVDFVHLKDDSKTTVGEFTVSTMPLRHPAAPMPSRWKRTLRFRLCHGRRVQRSAAGVMDHYFAFYADAEALVFDAQFSLEEAMEKEGWGHSSSLVGVDIALKANIKRLILFHMNPLQRRKAPGDLRQDPPLLRSPEARSGLEILLAREGLELEI